MEVDTGTNALPGFEDLVLPDVDRAGAQNFTAKEYTGIRIRKEYPRVFQSVVRALFFYKLPVSLCADLFSMNSQCVSAIRDMVIAESQSNPRAAFLINSRRQSQRDILLARLTDLIMERLDDEKYAKDLSIVEITSILSKLENAPAARNGTDRQSGNDDTGKGTIIDAMAYEDAINGLDAEKKSATANGGEIGHETDAENCARAFEVSNNFPKTPINSGILCSSLCDDAPESGICEPSAPPVHMGAGGVAGGARGGV